MQHEKIELNKLHAQSKVALISVQQVIFIFAAHAHTQINTVMGSPRIPIGRVRVRRDRSIKIN